MVAEVGKWDFPYDSSLIERVKDALRYQADTVSSRIAKIFGERSFKFSYTEWLNIHKRLSDGIRETMDYDFNTEKQFNYKGLSLEKIVKHLARFTSDIWQIHPLCEGNTRATTICSRSIRGTSEIQTVKFGDYAKGDCWKDRQISADLFCRQKRGIRFLLFLIKSL